jgi:predicted nucleic acid-binding protein
MITSPTTRGLIDTPVLIAYREGWPDAVGFITDLRQAGILVEVSQLSVMALLAWCRDAADRGAVDIFFGSAQIHLLTAKIMRRAQLTMETTTPPSPLTPDDAIVAATAIDHKLPLYTLDPARFAGVAGLSVHQPY